MVKRIVGLLVGAVFLLGGATLTAWAFDSRNAAALIGALLFNGLLALAYVGAVDVFSAEGSIQKHWKGENNE